MINKISKHIKLYLWNKEKMQHQLITSNNYFIIGNIGFNNDAIISDYQNKKTYKVNSVSFVGHINIWCEEVQE